MREADKSHSLFHHADFILHGPFDETGEQTWVESGDLRAGRSVQAIKAQRPANEQSGQSRREESSMYRDHRPGAVLCDV